MNLITPALREDIKNYFQEDDLSRNLFYARSLPEDSVECTLKIKDDLVLSGVPWFIESFRFLDAGEFFGQALWDKEGQLLKKGTDLELGNLPFSVALSAERIGLNLLQKSSAIATYTKQFVDKAEKYNIKILDTRKTTPGMRALEKYSVRIGGGYNHRLGQTDMWMVKDNHKTFFGGVEEAISFFQSMQGFYTPIEVEIHDGNELEKALDMGIKHLMLDNFSPEEIKKAISLKRDGVTYEISGGVRLENLENYLIEGIDAISIGALTYGAPPVDISFKFKKL